MTSVISRLPRAATFVALLSALPAGLTAQTAAPAKPAPSKPATKAPSGAPASREGAFLITARGFAFITGDKSDAVPGLSLPADRISTKDVPAGELDLSYFVTPAIALSVSGSYPLEHDTFISGSKIGSFKQTPLTARLQYHLMATSRFRPYLGAGVLVAPISNVNLAASGIGRFDLKTPAVGPVGQLGANYKLANHWFLNADARYALLKTTLKLGVNPVSKLGLNPMTFGGGIGYRF
jgi:outer membrane protein